MKKKKMLQQDKKSLDRKKIAQRNKKHILAVGRKSKTVVVYKSF